MRPKGKLLDSSQYVLLKAGLSLWPEYTLLYTKHVYKKQEAAIGQKLGGIKEAQAD